MQERATFAAGCFWGVEAAFQKIPGVITTRVGYVGGTKEKPKYEEVCTGTTGHREAVEVVFDTEKLSYDTLLKTFWSIHDPTTKNRQGADSGDQYNSAIFYHSPEQKEAAEASKTTLSHLKVYQQPIVTEIRPISSFNEAEEYHQQYLQKKEH